MSVLRRKSQPGTLVILALFLASSGAMRVGAGAGQALAESGKAAHGDEPAAGSDGGGVAENCPAPPAALAAALTERAAQIDNRSLALEERMAALALAEEAISARLVELEASESKLRATLTLADGAAEGDLVQLTSVYEAMKPKDTAAIFEKMEPDFAAGFLSRMRPEAAALVISGMKPETAYMITALIAGRNALVPKQ
jgi:flagellar motility protein MotE (MotC chaperone)